MCVGRGAENADRIESQIRFSCRRGCATCWPSCSERPTLRPTTSSFLSTQLRCSGRFQILDCEIGKSLRRGWSVQESHLRINAAAAASIRTILDKEEHSAAYGARPFRSAKALFVRRRSNTSNCLGEHLAEQAL